MHEKREGGTSKWEIGLLFSSCEIIQASSCDCKFKIILSMPNSFVLPYLLFNTVIIHANEYAHCVNE